MKTFRKILLLTAIIIVGLLCALPYIAAPVLEKLCQQKLALMGIQADVNVNMGLCWTSTGPGIFGKAKCHIPDSPWVVRAECSASAFQWHACAKLGKTKFDHSDLLVRKLLTRFPVNCLSNLTFSSEISFEASADRTFSRPTAFWSAQVKIDDLSAEAMHGEKPVSIKGFSLAAVASGLGGHWDLKPLRPKADTLSYGALNLTSFCASVLATETHFLIVHAQAGFCGGTANIYSLTLDPKTLNSGFTMYLDNIDAGKALTSFNGFEGNASGRLHGKLKAFMRKGGQEIKIREAFLYSVPGERGKLQLSNASAVTGNLALAGIGSANVENVSNALSDLDYSVLRLDLRQSETKNAALGVKIEGTATRGKISVPVLLDVTLHGDIDQLINTGLKLNEKRKDTSDK